MNTSKDDIDWNSHKLFLFHVFIKSYGVQSTGHSQTPTSFIVHVFLHFTIFRTFSSRLLIVLSCAIVFVWLCPRCSFSCIIAMCWTCSLILFIVLSCSIIFWKILWGILSPHFLKKGDNVAQAFYFYIKNENFKFEKKLETWQAFYKFQAVGKYGFKTRTVSSMKVSVFLMRPIENGFFNESLCFFWSQAYWKLIF